MEPRIFFERVRERHAKAVDSIGDGEFHFELAGRSIKASFASGLLLDRLTPALAHCERPASDEPCDATLLAWDTASSSISPPKPPWGNDDYRGKGRIEGYNRDGIHTAFHVGPNVLSMYDEESKTGIFWTPDGSTLPDYHNGSPFLIVLQWWAESEGLSLIHAGAVGTNDGGVLLAGAGGSGKSTTALSCLAAGFRYVSDDYCLLESLVGDRAHTLFCTGKLDSFSMRLLPEFESMSGAQAREIDEKTVIFLHQNRPKDLAMSLPIKAILLPRLSEDGTSSIRPSPPAKALHALAPSTIFQLTGAGKPAFVEMASLVRRLPCYHLGLGRDMREVPPLVASIIESL